jgi:hypothetical protein
MSLANVMEALARVEHKIDALMRWTGCPMPAQMQFVGNMCPACGMMIQYNVDFTYGVVVRRCDCKTGLIPSTMPPLPVTQPKKEQTNGTAADAGGDEVRAEDGPERRRR